jgi:hypothetical protein
MVYLSYKIPWVTKSKRAKCTMFTLIDSGSSCSELHFFHSVYKTLYHMMQVRRRVFLPQYFAPHWRHDRPQVF